MTSSVHQSHIGSLLSWQRRRLKSSPNLSHSIHDATLIGPFPKSPGSGGRLQPVPLVRTLWSGQRMGSSGGRILDTVQRLRPGQEEDRATKLRDTSCEALFCSTVTATFTQSTARVLATSILKGLSRKEEQWLLPMSAVKNVAP